MEGGGWVDPTGMVQVFDLDALDLFMALAAEGVVVDGVVTDPPYSSGGLHPGERKARTGVKYSDAVGVADFSGDNRDQRSYLVWSAWWMSAALRVTRPGGLLVVFCDWRQVPTITDAVQVAEWVWRGVVVWDKGDGRPRAYGFRQSCEFVVWASAGPMDTRDEDSRYGPGLVRSPRVPPERRLHPVEKPVAVMSELLEPFAPDSLVVDPFAGSGATLIAARDRGMRAIGSDYDPRWVEAIKDRLNAAPLFTGGDL